ncbi:MAG: hypothetical protein A3I63_03705 [Betaproteobacteria bacterium RIFCSPLOWO2_02_FULL_66_14]|nr:MAG: hypothetical protein A3I63_03705 [Betaproteobacteria bacterium RIFCSPLOWO2_02_FULL_66_14]
MTDQKEHRSKASLLINPRFQGQVVAFIVLAGFFCVVVTAYFYYSYVVNSYDFILQNSTLPPEIIEERYSDLYNLWVSLSLINVIIILVIAGWSLFITHRVAGSIYHVKRVIDEVKSGNAKARVHLREKDAFQDLANSLNEMLDTLQRK